jgi:hypothetical protein
MTRDDHSKSQSIHEFRSVATGLVLAHAVSSAKSSETEAIRALMIDGTRVVAWSKKGFASRG